MPQAQRFQRFRGQLNGRIQLGRGCSPLGDQLAALLKGGELLALQRLQFFTDPCQLNSGLLVIAEAGQGTLQSELSPLQLFLALPQRRVFLDAAAGEVLIQCSLNPLSNTLVMARLLHHRTTALLQLGQERIKVVMGFARLQQVVPSCPLHHPEMSPTGGQHRCGLTAAQRFFHAHQFSQDFFRDVTIQ